MTIGFLYAMLAAKPISVRRLSVLFLLSYALARATLGVLHAEVASSALTFSTVLTALVWVSPLIAFVCRTVRHRRIALETFDDVSLGVQLTHGSALLLIPILAGEMSFAPIHHLTVGVLLRGIALAGAGGLGYTIAMQVLAKSNASKGRTSMMVPRQVSVLSNWS